MTTNEREQVKAQAAKLKAQVKDIEAALQAWRDGAGWDWAGAIEDVGDTVNEIARNLERM